MSSRSCYPAGAVFRLSCRPRPSKRTDATQLQLFVRPARRSLWASLRLSAVTNVPVESHNLQHGKAGFHAIAHKAALDIFYHCRTPGHHKSRCNQRERVKRRCLNCGAIGHSHKGCPRPKLCYRCGEPGHTTSQCSSEVDKRTCFWCGEAGHLARDCPSRRKGGGDRPDGISAFLSRLFWGSGRG